MKQRGPSGQQHGKEQLVRNSVPESAQLRDDPGRFRRTTRRLLFCFLRHELWHQSRIQSVCSNKLPRTDKVMETRRRTR